MTTLARYLTSQVLIAMSFVLLALLVLFAFFDMIQELDQLGRNNYGLPQMALFIVLNMPGHIYEILPVAALIGTMFALSRLVKNSEYSVMRVSGLSNWRVAFYFAVMGSVLSLILLVLGEYVSPKSEQAAQRLRLTAIQSVVAQQFRSGLWVKDGRTFINVREVMPNSRLADVNIYEFDDNGRLILIRHAAQAIWQTEQNWELTDVVETRFGADGVKTGAYPSQPWRSVLSQDMLSVLLISPEKMSARTLSNYVDHLQKNRQEAGRYEIALWAKFITPFAIPVMVLLAMPFALQKPRSGGANNLTFIGILAGLGFHLLNRLFSHLGLLNGWPPFVVSSLPLVVFLGIALTALWWVDRR